MEKVIITADSACDLGQQLIKENNIKIIPLIVNIGERECKDGIDCVPDDIYNAVEQYDIVPKTSAISQFDFEQFFAENSKGGYSIIHISVSSGVSVTCNNASQAAKKFKNVFVIDSKRLSTGQGILVLKAVQLLKEGKTAQQIIEEIEKQKTVVNTSFVIDTLKYLHRGGRCSTLKMLAANMMGIRPEIVMNANGELVQGKKYFGNLKHVVKKYVENTLDKYPKIDKSTIFITHTVIDNEIVKMVEKMLVAFGFKTIYKTMAGATIACHCGKGCLGVLFFNEVL